MSSFWILIALQVVVGLGLLNVWLLRPKSATPYRGGAAATLKEEFAAYGLPEAAFYLVGALKISAGAVLLLGLFLPLPVQLAGGVVAVLMIGAIAMHLKVGDPLKRSLPAAAMLLMSLGIVILS